jgi:hypothetical protein
MGRVMAARKPTSVDPFLTEIHAVKRSVSTRAGNNVRTLAAQATAQTVKRPKRASKKSRAA